MSDDSIGRAAGLPRSTGTASPSGTCAIAPVRGDVTTMRAAAAVRARESERQTQRRRAGPAADAFPVRLLGVGPG